MNFDKESKSGFFFGRGGGGGVEGSVVEKVASSVGKSRKESPQKLTQLSLRSHPRHLVGKRTAQKNTIIDITSDSQVNSHFPYSWSPVVIPYI